MSRRGSTDHDWKDDGDAAEFLDDTEDDDAGQLYDGKQVDATHRHVA